MCTRCAFEEARLPDWMFEMWRHAQFLYQRGLLELGEEHMTYEGWMDIQADFAEYPTIKAEQRKEMAEKGTPFDIIRVTHTDPPTAHPEWNATYWVRVKDTDGKPLGSIPFAAGSVESRDIQLADIGEYLDGNGSQPVRAKLIVAFVSKYGKSSYTVAPIKTEE